MQDNMISKRWISQGGVSQEKRMPALHPDATRVVEMIRAALRPPSALRTADRPLGLFTMGAARRPPPEVTYATGGIR